MSNINYKFNGDYAVKEEIQEQLDYIKGKISLQMENQSNHL